MKQLLRAAVMSGLLLTALRQPAQAGRDIYGVGDGHNGSLTVAATGLVVNSYAQVTAAAAAGDVQLTVSSTTGFGAGDLVMVWQPTGLTPAPASGGATPFDVSSSPVGRWELARVSSVGATVIRLTGSSALLYGYAANLTQVVRVPEYTTVTINATRNITAQAWNGSTGGIVAFLANGTLTNNSSPGVVATGKGFRGGLAVSDISNTTGASGLDEAAPAGAQKGEGIVPGRYGPTQTGRGRVASAPGGGVAYLAGGGGGGNAGQGGQGGNSNDGARGVGGQGGAALTYTGFARLLPGAGGGSGHLANSSGQSGGAGGGVIFVRCNALAGAGSWATNGSTGGTTSAQDGASGGGGGGTLYLRVVGAATAGGLQAIGGPGGSCSGGVDVGPGGGGGGGFIFFQKGSGTAAPTGSSAIGASAGVQQNSVPSAAYGAQGGTTGMVKTFSGGFPILPVPTVTTPANGSFTNNLRPVLSGTLATTAAAGTQVGLVLDGVELAYVAPDAAGNFTFTPAADLSPGAHTLTARANNNSNEVYSADGTSVTFTIDATAPTAVISSTAGSPTTVSPIPVTVTFSENVTGFSAASLAITNGTPGGFAGSGSSYTFSVTPTAPGPVMVALAAGQAQDVAGNGNVAATPLSIVFQLPTPVIGSIAPVAGGLGQAITLTGSNFNGLTALSINGADALGGIISNTGSTLVVRVPATAAASGIISLATPTGNVSSGTFALLGAPGNTLDFDGTDDYVSTQGLAPDFGTGPFTLEAWVRTTGTAQAAAVGAAGTNDYWLGLYQNQAAFVVGGQRVQGSSPINDGRWHHLAGVRTSATQLALYVDGVLQNTLAVPAALAATPASYLAIGRYGNVAAPYQWAGRLDEVRLWNVARTAAQLRAALALPLVGIEPGLVLYHNFDQGSSAGSNAAYPTLYDLVSGQAATLNNFGLSGSSSNFVSSYALVVPTATASTARSATGFTANWTAPAVGTVTGYVLEVATTADFSTPVAGSPFTVAAPATSLAIAGLSAGSPCYYRVRALNSTLLSRGLAATPTDQGTYSNTIGQSTPLPVELSAFAATAGAGRTVQLAWATASEQNSARFEVERSLDGTGFERLGTVAAAGNSSSPRSYSFTDNQVPKTPSPQDPIYYRLKQVDQDGPFAYSPVRAVMLKAKAGLALYPNPATTGATLTGAQPGTVVMVFDALGRPVASASADATGTATLALPAGLPAGVYVVRAGPQALRLTVE